VALSTAFPQLGGLATLASELDLGANFGLRALYLRSETTNPAGSGLVRLAAADLLAWRNAANSADLTLGLDGADALTFAGHHLTGNPFLGASSAAGQSIPNAAATAVVFGTVETDTDSAYNPTTGVFTVPVGKAGQYSIVGQIAWNGALTTTTQLAVFVNGVEKKRAQQVNPGAGVTIQVDAKLTLAAGDAVDVRATQASGGAAALSGTPVLNFIAIKGLVS
jgi:hypothetical protein